MTTGSDLSGGAMAIELSIFRHLFASIAEEMGARLMRSAYSPNIKERRDYSCALFDHNGNMIAQAAHIPVHLGSTPMSVAAILKAFPPHAMSSTDVFVVNDPYEGGTHLPDVTVLSPCFLEGENVPRFFVANRAHHADVGGITPGSMPVSQHIDEEGFRISPQKLTPELISWMCGESRTPDERRGDLQAQLAAVRVGVERLQALCVTYQPDIVSARALALQQYTARMVRAAIHTWPNGTFQFSDLLDDDGFGHTALNITCQLTIKDDSLAFDFTETGPQTQGPVNAVRAITVSAVNYVIRCLVGGDVPVNSGVMEPVEVLTQPGSLVDAAFPAAVAAGNVETSQRLVDVVFGAFAKALPELVPAASCGSMNNVTIGGVDARTGSAFAYYETIAGGAGANADCHGASARHTHMTNTLNTPVEALEHAYPFRIDSYAIRTGSGGQGLKNGGDGVERVYAFSAPATVTLLTERRINPPYGLAGGQPGQVGNSSLFGVDGKAEALPPKVSVSVGPGQKLTILTPGGGGWGCLDGVDGDDKAKR